MTFHCYSQTPDGQEADQVRQSYPIKSSMKSSTSQPRSSVASQNYYVPPSPSPPPPPPSPPPTLPARSSSTVGHLPLSESMTNDLEFPPPPAEIGRVGETITRQALTEQAVVRETNNVPGRFSVAVEVSCLFSMLTRLKVSCSLSPGCRNTQRHWRALGVAHCRWQGFELHSVRDTR